MNTAKSKQKINRDEVERLVIQINHGTNGNVPTIIREIDEAIQWAWDNWGEDIVGTYYIGEKPSLPTELFIKDWVENEDFEADGFDIEQLAEL
jgi:hypothetical protein